MIAENLRRVRESIEKKCSEVNRDPSEIAIIAVSKNFSINEINTVFNEGIKNFGENKAQELMQKYNELGKKINWHFIGNLQRNKVRFAVEASEYIHSVDSLLLAMEINKRASKLNKIQKILLEIKTSDEESKSGLADESEIFDLAEYCKEYPNLDLVGLMTMAPYTADEKKIRKSFRSLRELRDELNGQGIMVKELSMGMTNDYLIAIEEGATMLRIGTAIFGERKYAAEEDQE
ncbi:MAG TPA: YggS family pyridoxal phosphate-dependent enzyme [Ignavibacteriaceae bacterium]|nr:YggS family pyridoxal phosphate-dependent enzyme [Ignavibacteriaceae bacterium]